MCVPLISKIKPNLKLALKPNVATVFVLWPKVVNKNGKTVCLLAVSIKGDLYRNFHMNKNDLISFCHEWYS